MITQTFHELIGNVFYRRIIFTCRVIVFVDEQKTHVTRETIKHCKSIQIFPDSLPCDVAAVCKLKAQWNKNFLFWRETHPHEAVTKFNSESCARKRQGEGFRTTEHYPFHSNAVDCSQCKGHIINNVSIGTICTESVTMHGQIYRLKTSIKLSSRMY